MAAARRAVSARLPDFPWDRLRPAAARARSHPGGIVDLSVGTPVDPVPAVVQQALAAAADAPGYPLTAGTASAAGGGGRVVAAPARRRPARPRRRAPGDRHQGARRRAADAAGAGAGGHRRRARPGLPHLRRRRPARRGGCRGVGLAVGAGSGTRRAGLGQLAVEPDRAGARRRAPAQGRRVGAANVARWSCPTSATSSSAWTDAPVSVLHPDVCGDSHDGVLAGVHSLSKRSNLAGYRFGFAAGDPALVAVLLAVRKHLGMMVPGPVQARRGGRARRRRPRCRAAGPLPPPPRAAARRARPGRLAVEHSEAGLYLWATRDEPCWETVAWFADRGILVGPGRLLRRRRRAARPGRPHRYRRADRGCGEPARRLTVGRAATPTRPRRERRHGGTARSAAVHRWTSTSGPPPPP